MVLNLLAGTRGFSYDEWKGSFYPADLPASEMLRFYATRLPTVEVNNTFYRMPKPAVLDEWSLATPDEFRFALKASRRITHLGKLRNVADSVEYLLKVSSALGDKLGALLFQLPPFLRRDSTLLEEFLALLPAGCPAALEFRHASWFDDAVYQALSARNVALVGGEPEEGDAPPFVATADWAYLRLRAEEYSGAAIEEWCARLSEQRLERAYVFFKHETKGPEYAGLLNQIARGPGLAKATPVPPKIDAPGLAATRPAATRERRSAKKRG